MKLNTVAVCTAIAGLVAAAAASITPPEAQAHGASETAFPRGPGPLRGTKCWELAPVVGKPVFLEISFLPIRRTGRAMFSGSAVRADGNSPDRVLQFTGSASRHRLTAADGSTINRLLLDAHYSMTKTGLESEKAFAELGRTLGGHYNIRLDADTLSGAFEGHDLVHDWTPPLSGPSGTSAANAPGNDYFAVAGANNYLGGITCDGSIPGFDNCGTIVPFNNSGSLTLVGSDVSSCESATPSLP